MQCSARCRKDLYQPRYKYRQYNQSHSLTPCSTEYIDMRSVVTLGAGLSVPSPTSVPLQPGEAIAAFGIFMWGAQNRSYKVPHSHHIHNTEYMIHTWQVKNTW